MRYEVLYFEPDNQLTFMIIYFTLYFMILVHVRFDMSFKEWSFFLSRLILLRKFRHSSKSSVRVSGSDLGVRRSSTFWNIDSWGTCTMIDLFCFFYILESFIYVVEIFNDFFIRVWFILVVLSFYLFDPWFKLPLDFFYSLIYEVLVFLFRLLKFFIDLFYLLILSLDYFPQVYFWFRLWQYHWSTKQTIKCTCITLYN